MQDKSKECNMHPKLLPNPILTVAIFLAASCALACAQTQVQTTAGAIAGSAENGVFSFKGVPFAMPPVGDLRWRSPQPPASWQGIRKATDFGPSCIQVKAGERLPWTKEFMVQNQIGEDCLYLNIWTPKVSADAKLPVIVFIHGGGFSEGSGAIEVYRGDNLAAKGVVVVTINYRLGVLGFLAHPELTAESEHHASGNYGLSDQIAALKWVNANIAKFGGDPLRVTIWGQSAGAFSVAAMVASPLAAGLFQQSQADSGLGVSSIPMLSLKDAEQGGVKFAEQHHAATLKELRALPAEALVADPSVGTTPASIRFSPIIDGWVLPDSPTDMNAKGSDNDVAVITGYQAGDSALFNPTFKSLDEYHQMIQKRYGQMATEFEKLYPVSNMEEVKAVVVLSGQERSRVSGFLWACARLKSHRQPVFTYYFDRGIPWPQHPEFGAFHTGEIPYFFLNLKLIDRPWEQIDFTLANTVSTYLINFATHGDPNGNGVAPWPKIDPSQPQTMELGARTGAMPLASKEKIDFWTRYFNSPISRSAPPF
jgi:para-nitrobenzyl esterase